MAIKNIFNTENEIELSDIVKLGKSNFGKRLAIILVTTLICSIFFIFHFNEKIYENRFYNIEPGYIWTDQSISAKFNFPVYKSQDIYNAEVQNARKVALQVFLYDENALQNSLSIIDSTIDNLIVNMVPNNTKDKKKKGASQSFEPLESARYNKIKTYMYKYFEGTYARGFVNMPLERINNPEISVRAGDNLNEKIFSKAIILDSNHFIDRATSYFRENLNEYDAQIALNLAKKALRPNIIFSQELTNRSKKYAEESVPQTIGIVREGDVIINTGQPITEEVIMKLQSYERARMNVGYSTHSFWTIMGSIGHAFMIYAVLLVFLYLMHKEIYYNNFKMILISFFVVFSSFLAWLSLQIQYNLPFEYLVIIPALSTLAAITLDSRTSFFITVTMVLMFMGIRGNDYDAGTAMLLAGTMGAYSVRNIKDRNQVFKSMTAIFIGFIIPVIFFGMERTADISQIASRVLAVSINSMLSPLITFGLLLLLEKTSFVTTELRVEEYNDLNHPLLLKLNEEAPGTYQHTMAVAMLAEKCASAINADALLTKVGAYFHDIGKLSTPQYFVENQMDSQGAHAKLTPQESADAIRRHVTEGINMAKVYKLPQQIIDFIPMHHGTTLIKYFYLQAVDPNNPDDDSINEADFRYFGPKPKTKETAILMICDAAEAMSRVAASDKDKFITLLEGMIKERVDDGQLNDSGLTVFELKTIKETCIRNLMAAAHPRVEYKKQDDSEQAAKEDNNGESDNSSDNANDNTIDDSNGNNTIANKDNNTVNKDNKLTNNKE